MSTSLEAHGFSLAHIFGAQLATGRLAVPVRLGDEQVYFFIDTGTRESVVLSLPFAESRGFLVLSRQVLAARARGQPQVPVADVVCPPFEAFGRCITEGQVSAYDTPRYSISDQHEDCQPLAGSLGLGFFADGVLGLDFQQPAVALTERLPVDAATAPALFELSFSRSSRGLLFLDGIRDAVTDQPLCLYFDSGALTSALAYDTAAARVPNEGVANHLFRWVLRWRYHRNVRRTERRVPWLLDFGGQYERRIGLWLVSSLKAVAARSSLDRVDGWVGTDIVQGGIAVLDFPASRLRVFPPVAPREA